jgi:Leucine-rich repeat (LRR) protein
VENNAIESLPIIIKHERSEESSQMEELRLNDNRIVEIKPGELFTKWSQLKRITLQNNKLQQLPDDIGNLKHIEELYLFGNELTHLPKGIGYLVQLKELDLYNNRLESLPEEIGNLVTLQRLTLEDNRLKAVPNSVANLTQLQVFCTRGNKDLKMSPFLVMLQTDK